MEASALSLAARALRSQLAASLALDEGQIFIGHPAGATPRVDGQGDKQFLNIFFYRIEHSGYPTDGAGSDPTYLRVYCLITAFGADEGSASMKVTAGENDLKLIGGVLASLHQHSVLLINDSTSRSTVSVQVVPAPFTVENIYNLWSTQASTAYRPSVAYELALVPVPFRKAMERGQLVGNVVLGVDASDADRGGSGTSAASPEWVPEIRFAIGAGFHQVLTFSAVEMPSTLDVAVAGKVGERVVLRWRVWTPADGWRATDAAQDAAVTLDSRTIEQATPRNTPLPGTAFTGRRQFTLVAVFIWRLGSGAIVEVTSNMLLISVFNEATA